MIGETVPIDPEPFLNLLPDSLQTEFQNLVEVILDFELDEDDNDEAMAAREDSIIDKVLLVYAVWSKVNKWDGLNPTHFHSFLHAYHQAYCWNMTTAFELSIMNRFKAAS